MPAFEQTRLVSALTYLVMALFVAGAVVSARYRRGLRRATIVLYFATLALTLAAIAVWFAGHGG